MEKEEVEKIKLAGKIAQEIRKFARELIKPGMKLIDIAWKVDDKIAELGAKPAFPLNLSIDNVAAHFTPGYDDENIAKGLIKADIGIQIDGYVADTAFSIDLEDSDENKKLIEAAEAGLKKALDVIDLGVKLGDIGKAVQREINEMGFVPIKNLMGHQIKRYDLHAGFNIPNYDSGQDAKVGEGLYAIEPFATNGFGAAEDGRPSGIYKIMREGNVRDSFAREVLAFILEEYKTLPFASRWIWKKFGGRGLLALRQIEQAGILYQYPQLMERGKGKVAQAEHSVLVTKEGKIVTTRSEAS